MSCKEALDQTHYGVDMFLAIAVTALSWRECQNRGEVGYWEFKGRTRKKYGRKRKQKKILEGNSN